MVGGRGEGGDGGYVGGGEGGRGGGEALGLLQGLLGQGLWGQGHAQARHQPVFGWLLVVKRRQY